MLVKFNTDFLDTLHSFKALVIQINKFVLMLKSVTRVGHPCEAETMTANMTYLIAIYHLCTW